MWLLFVSRFSLECVSNRNKWGIAWGFFREVKRDRRRSPRGVHGGFDLPHIKVGGRRRFPSPIKCLPQLAYKRSNPIVYVLYTHTHTNRCGLFLDPEDLICAPATLSSRNCSAVLSKQHEQVSRDALPLRCIHWGVVS